MSYRNNKILLCVVTLVTLWGCEPVNRIQEVSAGGMHTCTRSSLGVGEIMI